jgi:hypothetical protein
MRWRIAFILSLYWQVSGVYNRDMIQKLFSAFQLNAAWKTALIVFLASRTFYAVWSFAILNLFPVTYAELDYNDQPVLLVFDLRTSERHLYSRVLDGELRNFTPAGDGMLGDQTGTLWSLDCGCAVAGPDMGRALDVSSIAIEEIIPYKGVMPFGLPWLAMWQRFDANWYGAIASFGYGHHPDDTHFPPLYPMLIKTFLPITGHPLIAGLILSHGFALLMLVELHKFVSERFGEAVAARSLIYLMVFPSTLFFYSAYTESLFILLVLLFMNSLRDGRLHFAGLWAFCAILTRLQGVVLFLPLGYFLYRGRRMLSPGGIILALSLPALAAFYYLYLRWIAGGSSIIPLSEANWHARLVFPWENYWYAVKVLMSGRATTMDLLNLFLAVLLFVLIISGWRRFDVTLNIYSIATLAIVNAHLVDTQPLNSMSRFASTIFPVFILLAFYGMKNPMVNRLILYGGLALSLYLSAQFWLWGWVG